MEIKTKVYLKKDAELKTFYYNDDSKFKDHETELCKEGTRFVVSGYVADKSNALLTGEILNENLSIVLKNESTLEVFRVSQDLCDSHFEVINLN